MENPFEIIIEKLNTIEQLLLEMKISQAGADLKVNNNVEFMTIKQIAEYLTLSVATIYSMIHRMEIPNYKKGKRLYFKKSDIDAWITSGRRRTHSEIEQEADNYLVKKRTGYKI